MSPELFVRSVERAHRYRIHELAILEHIAGLLLTQGASDLEGIQVDEAFHLRDTYREGSVTDPPDLSRYDE